MRMNSIFGNNKKVVSPYDYREPLFLYKKRPLLVNNNTWSSEVFKYLHLITFTYPNEPTPEKKEKTKLFLENLLLPCDICERNFTTHVKENILTDDILSSRIKLVEWMIKFRNVERKNRGFEEYKFNSIINFYEELDPGLQSEILKTCCLNHS
jgi:hypothetical protein